jgi:hypothetical protein
VWSTAQEIFPYQLALKNIATFTDERDEGELPISRVLRPDQPLVFIGIPNYGSVGRVVAVEEGTSQLTIAIRPRQMPPAAKFVAADTALTTMSLGQAASRLQIPTGLVNRLLGDLYIQGGTPQQPAGKYNIGLKLKFNRREEEVLGYTTRGTDGNWYITLKAMELLSRLKQAFPLLLLGLTQRRNDKEFYAGDMFPGDATATMRAIKKFVESDLGAKERETVPCGTQALSTETIARLERLQETCVAGLGLGLEGGRSWLFVRSAQGVRIGFTELQQNKAQR